MEKTQAKDSLQAWSTWHGKPEVYDMTKYGFVIQNTHCFFHMPHCSNIDNQNKLINFTNLVPLTKIILKIFRSKTDLHKG